MTDLVRGGDGCVQDSDIGWGGGQNGLYYAEIIFIRSLNRLSFKIFK